ncbi:MAG: hypothetical protein ACFHWZ_13440 [Phycisphaerales bacterium]|nr:hypothetical protein [bacterium]
MAEAQGRAEASDINISGGAIDVGAVEKLTESFERESGPRRWWRRDFGFVCLRVLP